MAQLRDALHREEPGRLDLVVASLIPVISTALLAVLLFTQLPRTGSPARAGVGGVPVTTVHPDAGAPLPVSDVTEILDSVMDRTGHQYHCVGPYPSGGSTTWACRTPDAVVLLSALGDRRVYRIEATWFGFEPSTTDLPAWAASVQGTPELAEAAATWVARNTGTTLSMTEVGTRVETGGARGAYTLVVDRP